MIQSISPQQLKDRLEAGEVLNVIDVRMDWELDISRLDFAQQIVLDDLPDRLNEIPKDQPVVVFCRSGARSLQAGMFLSHQGWPEVYNLEGGILAWARQIDPSLPTDY